MKRKDFIIEIAKILEVDPATVNEEQALSDHRGWDSLAAVGFIAAAHGKCSIVVNADSLSRCRTIGDLLGLVEAGLTT